MSDSEPTVAQLHARLVDFRDRRNWTRFHTPKDLALSVSIESAELLEVFQWKSDDEIASLAVDPDFTAAASDEIADVLIYLVLLAGELGIDPLAAAMRKISTNETRFPEQPGEISQ